MSLPVRSPSKLEITPLELIQSAVVSPEENTANPLHQEINARLLTPPRKRAKMSQTEANSSPLSSLPTSPPRHLSTTGSTALVQDLAPAMVQPENDLASTAPLDSAIQTQQVHASQSMPSSAPAPNMSSKPSARQSPKRAREEDDDDDDDEPAFGTPPPKRLVSKANDSTNGGATAKKAPAQKKPATKRAAPRKFAAPPPTRSRLSRNRKAPERFKDLEEKTAPKALPTKKGPSKVFDPVFITTNSTSRLVKADIYHMLLEGSAWTSLSAEQQSTLVSMLPEDTASQALLTKIKAGETEDTRPLAFTLANDCFRTDVAKFQEDLKNGHLAKTWQAAAEQAVIKRAAGEYDAWKVEEAESWWGQKSK